MTGGMENGAIWKGNKGFPFPELEGTLEADIAIIGGGITGLTAAMLLAEAGRKVVLLEAYEIGSGTTGLSSCHLTTDIDAEYRNLYSSFDEELIKTVASSRKAAIDFIEKITIEKNIACDFRRLPGYLYTESLEDAGILKQEAEYAKKAGLNVSLTDSVPLHFAVKGLQFENQAEFNSQKYLAGLSRIVSQNGGLIFEHSQVNNIEEKEDYSFVKTSSGTVKARKIFHATHLPLFLNVLQTVAAPYRSYMIGVKLKNQNYPDGLFWDTAEPYHYTRTYKNENGIFLLAGGEDHKTGHSTNEENRFQKLEQYVRERYDVASVEYKWSAQYYEPADGVPYIGRNPFSKNTYVATGFSGDGLVYGTIAAMIISDMILYKENNWLKAYDSTRFTPTASVYNFLKENTDVARHFVKDRLSSDEEKFQDIGIGEGKIVKINGEKLAVSRDEDEDLHILSPVCTHLKCFVQWNNFEKTWDCPCHGSRFSMEGKVINGPAVKPLENKIEKYNPEKVKK